MIANNITHIVTHCKYFFRAHQNYFCGRASVIMIEGISAPCAPTVIVSYENIKEAFFDKLRMIRLLMILRAAF